MFEGGKISFKPIWKQQISMSLYENVARKCLFQGSVENYIQKVICGTILRNCWVDVDAMTCVYDKSLTRGHLIVYPFVCLLKCGVPSVCERVTRGSCLFAISQIENTYIYLFRMQIQVIYRLFGAPFLDNPHSLAPCHLPI